MQSIIPLIMTTVSTSYVPYEVLVIHNKDELNGHSNFYPRNDDIYHYYKPSTVISSSYIPEPMPAVSQVIFDDDNSTAIADDTEMFLSDIFMEDDDAMTTLTNFVHEEEEEIYSDPLMFLLQQHHQCDERTHACHQVNAYAAMVAKRSVVTAVPPVISMKSYDQIRATQPYASLSSMLNTSGVTNSYYNPPVTSTPVFDIVSHDLRHNSYEARMSPINPLVIPSDSSIITNNSISCVNTLPDGVTSDEESYSNPHKKARRSSCTTPTSSTIHPQEHVETTEANLQEQVDDAIKEFKVRQSKKRGHDYNNKSSFSKASTITLKELGITNAKNLEAEAIDAMRDFWNRQKQNQQQDSDLLSINNAISHTEAAPACNPHVQNDSFTRQDERNVMAATNNILSQNSYQDSALLDQQSLQSFESNHEEVVSVPTKTLSAYNFFFHEERDSILSTFIDTSDAIPTAATTATNNVVQQHICRNYTKEHRSLLLKDYQDRSKEKSRNRRIHRKTNGKISFATLSKLISTKWKSLCPEQKSFYHDVASINNQSC